MQGGGPDCIELVYEIYRAGRDNANADALSRQPYLPAPAVGTADDEVQVLSIEASKLDISSLIEVELDSITSVYNPQEFSQEQKKDDEILAMIQYLQERILPEATTDANCSSSTSVCSD